APQDAEPEGIAELLDERPFRRYARTHYSEERWRLHRWAYAKLTERVDREIGGLLDGLRAAGRDRDTVVVFTSDHGDHDAAHRLEHKTVPYREATRVPLLLRPAGGLDAPVVNRSHLVCNGLDLLPTLADYAGAEAPADLEGRSLRPFAEGAAPAAWRDSLCIESQNSVSILTERWQLTRYDRGAHAEQLYDLQADPGQTRNHAADPANGQVLADLRRRLAEREASAGAAPGRSAPVAGCAPQGAGRATGLA
ncbi:MAG: sulfatase, partial [Planctomycetota bacterium]